MPSKKAAAPPGDLPDFERALGELEEIVSALEDESLTLEEMVLRYEKGTQLLKRCEEVLAASKKRLRTIASRDQAGPSAEDPEMPLTPQASEATDAPDDDDEIRLF